MPGQLKNIDDDKRNVILLVHCSRSPPLEFGEHLTRQLGGGLQSIIAYTRSSCRSPNASLAAFSVSVTPSV